ncbi:MAG: lipoprotein-releasing ABC transporter permease subunit [Desulfurivibrionaceae bacterium]
MNNSHFERFICLRHLGSRRKHGFISLITAISIGGVAVGVMALIVVLAVMSGFTSELRDKILGVNSHIIIQKSGGNISDYPELIREIKAMEGVKSAVPYIYSQTMITGGRGGAGIVLRGVDPDSAASVLSLPEQVVQGDFADLKSEAGEAGSLPGILLGKHLAGKLAASPGKRLRILSLSGPLTPMGTAPKMKTCEVAGIFDTGMYEYDSSLAYVSLETAQDFLNMEGEVNGLELRIDNIYEADTLAGEIEEKLGTSFIAKDWMTMNHNLFSALKLEKTAMFIVLTLIVLVAAFNIISTLTMVVMEKKRDIAILKSMGATSRSIMKIFVYEGLIIGSVGMVIGVIGGLGLCEILSRYNFITLPGDVYPMSTLPVAVNPLDVTIVAISAVLITFLATVYPSWQASRVEPVEALR